MDPAATQLRENYALRTTEELIELRARDDLTPLAYGVLDEELKSRGVPEAQVKQEVVIHREARATRLSALNRLAGRGTRLGAKLIDVFGVMLVIGVLAFGVFLLAPPAVSDAIANVLLLVWLLYLLFKDGFRGQSIGKRLLKIVVVEVGTGQVCSLPRSAVRNAFSFLGIIDWVWALGENRQRLGDIVAGTCVVVSKDG